MQLALRHHRHLLRRPEKGTKEVGEAKAKVRSRNSEIRDLLDPRAVQKEEKEKAKGNP